MLVLADNFAPGWTATVDGRDAPVVRANHTLRGVALDAGAHEVVFRCRAPGLRRGLAISVAATLLLALVAGADVVTARKVGRYAKRHVSRVYNCLSRLLLDVPVRDCNSMKAMRREVLAELPARRAWHRWRVACAVARGYAVSELDVALHPRQAGRSKYVGWRPVARGACDLVLVWRHLRRTRVARRVAHATRAPMLAPASAYSPAGPA